ncbi:hypothetical protein PAHAL_7G285700 [Panicum hallii]|uniref:Uncharacterized protein n=1 Tax=Panicum hallii TaxID=206008 RepID=A0A2S3IAT2_9POAL|nr:hypothetical protein PAHAL_7G285700 [Panicum hallii]
MSGLTQCRHRTLRRSRRAAGEVYSAAWTSLSLQPFTELCRAAVSLSPPPPPWISRFGLLATGASSRQHAAPILLQNNDSCGHQCSLAIPHPSSSHAPCSSLWPIWVASSVRMLAFLRFVEIDAGRRGAEVSKAGI